MDAFGKKVLQLTVATGIIPIEGVARTYRIVSRELELRLLNFVGFHAGELLFISEEVPPGYRPPFLAHEVLCNPSHPAVNACVRAVRDELRYLAPNLSQERYLVFRRRFFEGLVEYFTKHEKPPNEQFMYEIRGSLQLLRQLTGL